MLLLLLLLLLSLTEKKHELLPHIVTWYMANAPRKHWVGCSNLQEGIRLWLAWLYKWINNPELHPAPNKCLTFGGSSWQHTGTKGPSSFCPRVLSCIQGRTRRGFEGVRQIQVGVWGALWAPQRGPGQSPGRFWNQRFSEAKNTCFLEFLIPLLLYKNPCYFLHA